MGKVLVVLDFLASLPSWGVAVTVVALSLAIVFALSRMFLNRWLFIPAIVVPLAVSNCIYWAPVWDGADRSAYAPWATVFIATWSIAGAVVCSTLVSLLLARATGSQRVVRDPRLGPGNS